MSPTIVTLDAAEFTKALPELLTIYAAAMNYQPRVAQARASLWLDHARRIGFRCVVALEPAGAPDARHGTERAADPAVVGFAYGYRGAIGQWWFSEVARGLGSVDDAWLGDYFELTELHVQPTRQGHGTGEALLRALVAPAPNRTVLLSTPEGENRAWRLYRRLGFTDVLRHFLFTGDSRPFAVLGRALPLESAERAPEPSEVFGGEPTM